MANSFGIHKTSSSPNNGHINQSYQMTTPTNFSFPFANGSLKSDCHAMILLNDANCPSFTPVTEAMTDLFERKVLLDFSLEARNGRIKVHRLALAAASHVLEDSLSRRDEDVAEDMSSVNHDSRKESFVDQLDLSDYDVSTVQAMVEFIYYGEVNDSELNMLEVIKLADTFDLQALKFSMAQRIYRSLTPDNAIESLALAESTNCDQLKQLIPCFIAENASRVTSTNAWKETFKDRSDLVANLLAVTATDLSMNGSSSSGVGNKKRKTSF